MLGSLARSTTLRSATVLGVAAALALGATSCAVSEPDDDASSTSASSTPSESASSTPSSSPSRSASPSTSSSSPVAAPSSSSARPSGSTGTGTSPGADEPPVWSFPANVEGWTMTVFDQNGINQLQNEQQCRFTSSQNVVEPSTSTSDEEATEDLIDDVEAAFLQQGASVESELSEGKINLGMDGAAQADALRLDSVYEVDGDEYTSILLARVFAEEGSWVTLQYACPSAAFDESEFNELAAMTALMNAEDAARF